MSLAPLAVGGVGAGGAFLAWSVRGRSAAVFGRSVWHGDRNTRAIALTFDDGPSESTPELLDVLAQYRAPATFFQVGMHVNRLPEVSRAVLAAGHEIGNHSYSHPLFFGRPPAFIESELRRTQEAIHARIGVEAQWFRAPYGVRWLGMGRAQRRLGLTGVMWTTIARDWTLNSAQVFERLANGAGNGGILCLHDGRGARLRPDIRVTVEAVRRLVPALLEQGYRFETISRLLCPTN